jgi:hypothetical protein
MGEQTVWRPMAYERGPRVGARAALRIETHRGILDVAFGRRPAPYWD